MRRLRSIWMCAVMVWVLSLVSCGGGESGSESLFPSDVVRSAEQALGDKVNYLGVPYPEFPDSITDNEMAALKWIYAYSYTPDILDHSVGFHLANIRVALRAREELPWGRSVPLEQWRAFVLPTRVNNEILDDFRTTYYEELRDLVRDMTMEQAVLELNHWAHQHITYAPSDGRTSSPLATLRNALGRCGEQSTFLVAVLRTVGIPARQVYTPRWAHTDDNHAWVEAWVDGEWHYMGASEPAPVLDHAWFDASVLRAMLLHTRAFGPYQGQEEWLGADKNSTELNVSENYIPTAQAMVTVLNAEGEPQEGVKVTFRIYNYAELYPAVTRVTNRLGEASVQLGYGDVVVVASRSAEEMAIGKLSNKEGGGKVTLTLAPWSEQPEERHMVITPPIERTPQLGVTPEMEQACQKRMAHNTSIRTAYTDSFPTEEQATAFVDSLGMKGAEAKQLAQLYKESRGYHHEIADFLRKVAAQGKVNEARLLLASLVEKDLHDVSMEVLREQLDLPLSAKEWQDPDLISPRVMLEHLYPVQQELSAAVKEIASGYADWEQLSIADRANAIAKRVETFRVDELYNPLHIVLSPATVWAYKVGDSRSLQVLLVRLLRAAGISSRYDTANGVITYKDERGKAQILPLMQEEQEEQEVSADCQLILTYKPEGHLKNPKYETNFSVGYVDEEGQLATYGFDWQLPYDKVSGAHLLYDKNYILTGTRLADGSVLLALRKQECGVPSPLLFDKDETAIGVIGSLNAESLYYDLDKGEDQSIISTTGRGYYLLVLGKAHHEPTDHILRDLRVLGEGGEWPLPTLVLLDSASEEYRELLPQATWGEDRHGIEAHFVSANEITGRLDKPVVVIADTFNRVVFISQGYTIGIGERVAQVIAEIK